MKAVVFAAVIGSRLKPFTDHHPKALATIAGKPLLGHVLDKISAAGFDEVVVNVHHFPEQISAYLLRHYPHVRISDESPLLLDTAGALAKIYREGIFGTPIEDKEPVLVHNADIYTDFDISEMLTAHHDCDATLLVDGGRQSSRELLFDHGRMRGWHNVKTGEFRPAGCNSDILHGAAFGGVHILSGATIKEVDAYVGAELRPVGIVDYYVASCLEKDFRAFTPAVPYRWFDIGTPQKLEQARADVEGL